MSTRKKCGQVKFQFGQVKITLTSLTGQVSKQVNVQPCIFCTFQVCFHIEPFKNRTSTTLRDNLAYILRAYSDHPALYTVDLPDRERPLPLFYFYDSYQVSVSEWQKVLLPGGEKTVRNTELDGVYIGLLVEMKHHRELKEAGFDGFYTYFASDGFTYGSTTKQWMKIAKQANRDRMLFIPSVGPGYVDTRVRPWNGKNTKDREDGKYYERSFSAALDVWAKFISITSFNEWHEGTQIESAVPKSISGFTYEDYSPHQPDYYLAVTRKWSERFTRKQGS